MLDYWKLAIIDDLVILSLGVFKKNQFDNVNLTIKNLMFHLHSSLPNKENN
jgi:hypothetical protein